MIEYSTQSRFRYRWETFILNRISEAIVRNHLCCLLHVFLFCSVVVVVFFVLHGKMNAVEPSRTGTCKIVQNKTSMLSNKSFKKVYVEFSASVKKKLSCD